jgi:hypothetical protein
MTIHHDFFKQNTRFEEKRRKVVPCECVVCLLFLFCIHQSLVYACVCIACNTRHAMPMRHFILPRYCYCTYQLLQYDVESVQIHALEFWSVRGDGTWRFLISPMCPSIARAPFHDDHSRSGYGHQYGWRKHFRGAIYRYHYASQKLHIVPLDWWPMSCVSAPVVATRWRCAILRCSNRHPLATPVVPCNIGHTSEQRRVIWKTWFPEHWTIYSVHHMQRGAMYYIWNNTP